MGKDRKLKGGMALYVSEDETFAVTSNARNSVYVYDISGAKEKLVFSTRTVSNVAYKAVSPDKKLLACKNTSGEIAVISLESGTELFRNKMQKAEGYKITFTDDGRYVMDLDWGGTTMSLDCTTGEHKVLDGPNIRGKNGLPYVSYMGYDKYSKQIYKIVEGPTGHDMRSGVVMAAKPDPDKVKYKEVRKIKGFVPGSLNSISLCKKRNYYFDPEEGVIVAADKKFQELERISLPPLYDNCNHRLVHTWISPGEKYAFITYAMDYALLFDLEKREIARKFPEYGYNCDFTMVRNDTVYIISTWEGAFMGEL